VGLGTRCEHRCGTGKEPGKVVGGRAHRTGGGDIEVEETLIRRHSDGDGGFRRSSAARRGSYSSSNGEGG
jgi:hypothetical protein